MFKEYGHTNRVAMCKVDCDIEVNVAKRFKIMKYPTLKVSLNGDVMKKEYRGQRSSEGLVEFIHEQMKDPIKEIMQLDELKNLNTKKRSFVAYFDKRETHDYNLYRRVAANLREECDFYAVFDDTVATDHAGGL